jgi:hypothetical protein
MNIVLWTGGNAPDRNAKLTVTPTPLGFDAYWEPGYCGCPDCHPIVGNGRTEEQAIADYWERWEEEK